MLLPRISLAAILVLAGATSAGRPEGEVRVFFGNLHSHTSYSDGSAFPENAYEHARDVARLDFLAITEHNHAAAGRIANDHSLYSGPSSVSLKSTAGRFNVDGSFVALYGQEFSTISSGNHVNVFEVSDVIDTADVPNGSFNKLLDWLQVHRDSTGQVALLLLNHPATNNSPNDKEYGRDDFGSAQEWISKIDSHAELINIINGPSHEPGTGHRPGRASEGEFLRYLSLGFHVAPTADQDNHKENWGDTTDARTAVIAKELTKTAVLDALRARNVYATEDKNLRLTPRVNGHLIGTIAGTGNIPGVGSELSLSIEIQDDDEPLATYEVQVFSGKVGENPADVVRTAERTGNGVLSIPGVSYEGGHQYVFFKVRQSHDDAQNVDHAWTAPVWFDPSEPAPSNQVNVALTVDLAKEEARVTNMGDQQLDLSAWKLVSTVGAQEFKFPAGTVLAAGASVTVTSGRNARSGPGFLLWTKNFIWNNSGDPAELYDKTNKLIVRFE